MATMIPSLNNIGRAIPDRQGCSQPEKRVLDALTQGMQQVAQWSEQMRTAVADLESVQKEQVTVDRASGSGTRTPSTPDVPRYKGQKSIVLQQGNIFEFENDEAGSPRKVYSMDKNGKRGWLSAANFISQVLGEDLDAYMNTYMNTWITNYIQTNGRKQYVSTGTLYSEATGKMEEYYVELVVLDVVKDSTLIGTVFTAQECP